MWSFSGLVKEADSSPIVYCCVQNGWHLPIRGIFLSYEVRRPTPWPSRKNLQVSALLLRFPLQKSVSKVLGGGYEVVGEFGVSFPRNLDCLSRLIFSEVSALVNGLIFIRSFMGAFLRDFHLLVPCSIGSPKLSEGLLSDCNWCTGKSSPCLLFFVDLQMKRISTGYIPLSLMGILV